MYGNGPAGGRWPASLPRIDRGIGAPAGARPMLWSPIVIREVSITATEKLAA